MKYTELELKAMKDELARLEPVIYLLEHGWTVPVDRSRLLTTEDIDRAAAEMENRNVVESMDFQTTPMGALGTRYGVLQEDQRVRRDAVISRQSHKRLMLGCLETSYRRMRKLLKETGDA